MERSVVWIEWWKEARVPWIQDKNSIGKQVIHLLGKGETNEDYISPYGLWMIDGKTKQVLKKLNFFY